MILPESLLPFLVRTSLALVAAMVILRTLLWLLAIRSPRLHRWASVLVLLQGWMFAPLVLSIPWYDPPEPAATVHLPQTESVAEFPMVVTGEGLPTPVFNNQQSHTASLRPHFNAGTLMRRLGAVLVATWFVGVGLGAILLVTNYWRFVWQIPATLPLDDATQLEWRRLLRLTNGPASLPLRMTDSLGPMLCLLPRGYEIWMPRAFWQASTPTQRAAILRHELSHYRRGDIWKSWLTYLLALPQWFNPAAWWAVWNFQQAGEWLCDLDATTEPQNRADYLHALLRLVELHPPRTTVAGHCAHAHPLLVRVRRLLSPLPRKESCMNKWLFGGAAFGLALLPWLRIELVARAAPPPASLQAVKDQIEKLDRQLEDVKSSLASLKERGENLKATFGDKTRVLNDLAENPAAASEELKRRAQLFMSGEESKQKEALQDLNKLVSEDERILLLGQAAKASPHEAVRRQALAAAVAQGEAGYPAIGLAYESLNGQDRGFLVKEINKLKTDDKLVFFALVAKEADAELLKTLLGLELDANQRLTFLGAIAESRREDEQFAEHVVSLGDKTQGDGGVLILYAIAKAGAGKHAAAAVNAAVKRKEAAWPVIAIAYKKEEKESRAACVKAAKQLGGEAGDFLLKTALEDSNPELRAAAEEAAK